MTDQNDQGSIAEFWEYVIAGIVILFFGALFWMLTRDIPEGDGVFAGAAPTVVVADEQPSRVAQVYAERAKLAELTASADDDDRIQPTANAADSNTVAPPQPAASAVQTAQTAAVAIPAAGAVTGAVLQDQTDNVITVDESASINVAVNEVNAEVSTPDAPETLDTSETSASVVVESGSETRTATNDLEAAITSNDEQTSFVFDALYFDTGSENIKPESRPQIEYVADVLTRYPDVKVLIRGHTDNTGTIEGNAKLALDRSVSVGLALVALGVTKDRIEVESVGSNEPVASNDTEEGRQQNRRIELRIIE